MEPSTIDRVHALYNDIREDVERRGSNVIRMQEDDPMLRENAVFSTEKSKKYYVEYRYTPDYWREWMRRKEEISCQHALQRRSFAHPSCRRSRVPHNAAPSFAFAVRTFEEEERHRHAILMKQVQGIDPVLSRTWQQCYGQPLREPDLTTRGAADKQCSGHASFGIAKRFDVQRASTADTELATAEALSAAVRNRVQQVPFQSAPRFDLPERSFAPLSCLQVGANSAKRAGPTFSKALQLSSDSIEYRRDTTPCVGSYNIPSLFNTELGEARRKLTAAKMASRPVFGTKPEEPVEGIVFGFGCNLEEHINFGCCLDGMCGKRAPWERIAQQSKDVMRISKSQQPHSTSLHFACHRGDEHAVHKLCLRGVNVNATDERGRIPLHVAVELKHLKVVVRLLENSSHVYTNALGYQEARSSPDVNAQDLKGWTSLHYAALTGDMDICTAGADPSILAFDSTSVFQGCSSHDCFRIMSVTLKEQQLTEQLKKVAEKMSRAQSLASFEHLRSKTSCAICDTNRNLNAAQS